MSFFYRVFKKRGEDYWRCCGGVLRIDGDMREVGKSFRDIFWRRDCFVGCF